MIKIVNLHKHFEGLNVLRGIDLTVETGQIYGLAGRSGAGKSTLLRCINGLETYDEGSLCIDGIEVCELKGKQIRIFRKDIGMIFQNFSLLGQLTTYRNIAFPMECWRYKKSYIDRRVKELAEMVGISDKLNAYPSQLSGGQKQRVAIARALAMSPKLLLCDEATSALDPNTAASFLNLLKQINEQMNITIIIVAHQMAVIRSICHSLSIIENGRIAASGTVEQIFLEEPLALKNLIGEENNKAPKPKGTTRLKVISSGELANQPVLAKVARSLNIDFSIISASMERVNEVTIQSSIIDVSDSDSVDLTQKLKEYGVICSCLNESALKESS
ncbi:methionine ABC transporter ATP-binding protein [Lutispora sp.]|uniref:methionine ABC transporter ATP-binding protein n=1 Tax=Lutispora sp. TaxID=2828727 RepID=UPI000EE1BC97|nr:methionine ABC transporter ATP-binding protein [Lutispora sp.]MEA4961805.1 methionine ABC transporter ATP-binding protein [Lutispora sp.]HCJ57227.1 ABC transporter ATP-binding protein [Clostridiaceae bacterium]